MDRNSSIAVFDSGFGGLTVMCALKAALPHENILYFGDTAHLPYGNKSREAIVRYASECCLFLAQKNLKLLIIACHSACSAGLVEALQEQLPFPIIGVTSCGIEEVVRVSLGGHVAILGTRATISSGLFQKQIQTKLPKTQVTALACPLFVPLVEEGFIEHPLTEMVVKEYLGEVKGQGIDTLLLGCTHYPLLKKAIQKELGEGVLLIDPALACVQKASDLLKKEALLSERIEEPPAQFFVSDDAEKFKELGQYFLGHCIPSVALYLPSNKAL
jgi:glutamate racemase